MCKVSEWHTILGEWTHINIVYGWYICMLYFTNLFYKRLFQLIFKSFLPSFFDIDDDNKSRLYLGLEDLSVMPGNGVDPDNGLLGDDVLERLSGVSRLFDLRLSRLNGSLPVLPFWIFDKSVIDVVRGILKSM